MVGFAIYPRKRRVSPETVARFRGLPVTCISDVAPSLARGGLKLRPMHAGQPLAGPALTVRTRPGDNLMVHKALDLAERGDVIVVDAGADLTTAIAGEMMLAYMMHRGIGGIVVSGAIRDIAAIRGGALPVYAGGIAQHGPSKEGPGEINVPVSVDGMLVEPGDLIVGDATGWLCISYDTVEEVYGAAKGRFETETRILSNIAEWDRAWVDTSLKRLGCRFEDEPR